MKKLEIITLFLFILICLGDLIVPYILSIFTPQYSHLKNMMSELGSLQNKVAIIYNAWLIIFGIVFVYFSLYWYCVFIKEYKITALFGMVILILFGIGSGILAGILHIKPGNSASNMASNIHALLLVLGFFGFLFFPVITYSYFKINNHINLLILSKILTVTGILFFILFVISERKVFNNTIIGLSGLWQRLLLVNYYILPVIISLRRLQIIINN